MIDPVDPQDQTQIKFIVKPGESLTRVASNLKTQNLIRNRSVFKYLPISWALGKRSRPVNTP